MRTLAVLLLVFLFVNESFGQIKYEKGYFVNTQGERIECLIKNRDWKNNPSKFIYKLNDSSKPEDGNIHSVKEFGIYNYSKFVGADVEIDRSNIQENGLAGKPELLWSQEKLFLRVLVEGTAKLYSYDNSSGRKFFYSVSDTAIDQLIYKKFNINFASTNTIGQGLSPMAEISTYKNQLLMDLKCPKGKLESVDNLTYTTEDIERYFRSYNKCMGDTSPEMVKPTKKSYVNLRMTAGINPSSLSIPKIEGYTPAFELSGNEAFSLGLQFEAVIPYHKQKWAVVFEPTFQYFNAEAVGGNVNIKYRVIEFPIGVRHYFKLSDHSRIYLNGFYNSNFTVNFDSSIQLYDMKLGISPSGNWALGGGFEHKRLSLETRYYTEKNLWESLSVVDAHYSRFAILVGFKIIKAKY